MSPGDIIDLLTLAAAYDQRTTGQGDVAAWHAALHKLDLDEAQEAVIMHYREKTARIMPADVWQRCRPQATRHLSLVEPVPARPERPRDPERWHRMWTEAMSGQSAACAARRAVVLAHPEVAARLRKPPLDFAHPDQWNGFVPPELFNGERNDSPRREALAAIVADAVAAQAQDDAPAGEDR